MRLPLAIHLSAAALIGTLAIGCGGDTTTTYVTTPGSTGGGGTPGPGGGGTPPPTGGPVQASSVGGPGTQQAPPPLPVEGRALWVTRWYANTEQKIRDLVDYADRMHFNIILLQVYGDSYALYPSQIAPRSSLVSASFDPLALAVPLAHAKGIEVHAWINSVRVYAGGIGTPSDPEHILRKHPEWSMVDGSGVRSFDRLGSSGAEIFACPEHDGFKDYVVGVCREMAQGYEIDGIHLDYIRYPSGTSHCYCTEHQRKFTAQYGRAPQAGDPDWDTFRYETITKLVSAVHDAVAAYRPTAAISGAKTRFFSFQDYEGWFKRGKLDIAFPMLYTSNLTDFSSGADTLDLQSNGRLVMPGISVTSGALASEVDITRQLGSDGFALFASNQIDATHDAQLQARMPTKATVPPMPWKDGSPDLVAPRITTPGVLPGQSQVTVEWESDELTYGRVEVRAQGAGFASAILADDGLGLQWEHRATVTGLTPGQGYTLHVVSTDAAGNWRSSADASFTTAAPGPVDLIVDNGDPGYVEVGGWSTGSSAGGNGNDYRYASGSSSVESASATFRPALPEPGLYKVSAWYVSGTNRVSDAAFVVAHQGGTDTVRVNQQLTGKMWVELGQFRFDAGSQGFVKLSNLAGSSGVVIADAVRFERISP